MSEVRVEFDALSHVATVLRAVVGVGIPSIGTGSTCHPDLDSAIEDLRSALAGIVSGTDEAAAGHATNVERAAQLYLATDASLNRPGPGG